MTWRKDISTRAKVRFRKRLNISNLISPTATLICDPPYTIRYGLKIYGSDRHRFEWTHISKKMLVYSQITQQKQFHRCTESYLLGNKKAPLSRISLHIWWTYLIQCAMEYGNHLSSSQKMAWQHCKELSKNFTTLRKYFFHSILTISSEIGNFKIVDLLFYLSIQYDTRNPIHNWPITDPH